ncbi:MAG: nicotinamide mononucleotide transporter [Aureispira sp.]|nr:nicotinamide mononucleotide transporter [Aureispira sp.]
MFFDIFRSEAGFIGLTFNLFFVILAMRQSIWAWPMRIFSIIAYLIQLYVVTEQIGGYPMWFSIGFLGLSIYGWYTWASIKEQEDDEPQPNDEQILDVHFAKHKKSKHQTSLFPTFLHYAFLVVTISFWVISLYTTDIWFSPSIWYAIVMSFRFLAEFFLARKWIECWLFWIAADLSFLIPFWMAGGYSYIFVYSLPVFLATVGYIIWRMPSNPTPKVE